MKTLLAIPLLGLVLGLALAVPAPAQETPVPPTPAQEDPYLWLEDVTGDQALAWVKARNAEAAKELATGAGFQELQGTIRKIMDSSARIPYVSKQGAYYYNFWRDAKNPRGLWRRTSLAEYRKAGPKWDVLLDLDELCKQEKANWVWHGAEILKQGGYRHVLINLSRGGADASIVREYDLEARAFVKDGFQLAESKGGLNWIDRDSVYVATDFGPGTLTTSGYPRVVKLWKRGTALDQAAVVYAGQAADMNVGASFDDTKGFERHFVYRGVTMYTSELFLRKPDGSLQKVEVPADAKTDVHREWLLVEPKTAWTVGGKTFAAGSLLAMRFDAFLAGQRGFAILHAPTPTSSLAGHSWTRHHLILNVLEDVKNRLAVLTPGKAGWKRAAFVGVPANATVQAGGVDAEASDDYFMNVTGFLDPPSLYLGAIGKPPVKLKETPAFFDSKGLLVSQHFVTSKDGTRVPYFQISRRDLALNGLNPTLLYGYGGFEISMTPGYSANAGAAWTGKGGVYVVANIRGGGEYGPRWHQAALKQNRHRAYEDFAAVAQDLIARQVTSPAHLGAQGGSNGGLLMGNMITLYPQLFGAVVCQVPLLDMKRYSHLLAGASWMAEYGDPDQADQWAYIKTFSPYQNLKPGVKYPPTLFTTSTRDDRVHPGHARKMMAAMLALGADVRSYENIEGGHGGAANNEQASFMTALAYSFLWQKLK